MACPDHRCYLWQQQERIDRLHQERYCLTELHTKCPWLMLPRPNSHPKRNRAGTTIKAITGGTAFLALIGLIIAAPRFGFDIAQHVPLSAQIGPLAPASSPDVTTRAPGQPDPRLLPPDALSAELLTGTSPTFMTISIPTDRGGAFAAGNVGFSFPSGALKGLDGPISVAVKRRPVSVPLPVAPWQISSHGTIFQLAISDAQGKQVTTFPAPVTVLFKYSDVDLAVAAGDPAILTAGLVIDSRSPLIANPVGFPFGTWVFFPPSVTHYEAGQGTVSVETQVAPTVLGIMTRPYTQVRVVKETGLYSSFARTGKLFGVRATSSVLQVAGPPMQVVGPQIESRLLILDPATNNYAYVNAADVSPVLAGR